jgi:hypothetical protein
MSQSSSLCPIENELIEVESVSIPVKWLAPEDISVFAKSCDERQQQPGNRHGEFLRPISLTANSMFDSHEQKYQVYHVSKYFESGTLISVVAMLVCIRPETIRKFFCLEEEIGSSMFESDRKAASDDIRTIRNQRLRTASELSDRADKYTARIWFGGKWNFMDFHCKLPCRSNGQLLSSYSKGSNTLFPWLPFLEKAVASVFGGFGSLRYLSFETILRQIHLFEIQTI